jgi:hypothetical protein
MDDLTTPFGPRYTGALAGALAHLAQHLESGCGRSAYLAALLLDQVADDTAVDQHMRQHARQLVEVLERDPRQSPIDRLLGMGGWSSPADQRVAGEAMR